MNKKSIVIIPARLLSTRLPNKPLLKETGKFMIQYAYEAACQSIADKVVIATDDQSIVEATTSFGGLAVLTKNTHLTGTDRIAEVASMFADYEIIINLQGDEPEVQPENINQLINIQNETNAFISTLCCLFQKDNYHSCALPSTTKVALGNKLLNYKHEIRPALYFSRSLIPYYRINKQDLLSNNNYYLHLGIYGFSQQSLAQYIKLPAGNLENTESLEQLRALENGYQILCGIVSSASAGIDTPQDYQNFVNRIKKNSNQ